MTQTTNPYLKLPEEEIKTLQRLHKRNLAKATEDKDAAKTAAAEGALALIEAAIKANLPQYTAGRLPAVEMDKVAKAFNSVIATEIDRANNGDSGNYDPETTENVINSRAALAIISRFAVVEAPPAAS